MTRLDVHQPLLIFLGDVTDVSCAKTAFGLRDWAPERCVGQYALPGCSVSSGLQQLTPHQAYERGARAMVIGIANQGGSISAAWLPALLDALHAGLDLISGMHAKLQDIAELTSAAERLRRRLIDVRRPPANIAVATGRKRSGNRLLTVGTDCALGKKYTALALTRALRARGIAADFRATGQTGILIAGSGIPMDAVVGDFVAGAAEALSPDASADHWDIVEGQGSLFHPSYAGVSLGLLHGTQPDVIVVCHQLGRQSMVDAPQFPVPSVEETIDLNLRLASRTNPRVRCAGVALNTADLTNTQAHSVLAEWSARLGLPVADPVRGGLEFERLVGACMGA